MAYWEYMKGAVTFESVIGLLVIIALIIIFLASKSKRK